MTVNAVAPGARRCCSVQPPEGVTMHSHPQWRAGALGLSLLWAGALAQSQGLPDAAADSYEALRAKVEALRVQLRQQQQLLDALTRQLGPAAAERGAIAPPRSAVAPEWLAEQRGMGGQQGGAGTPPAPATQAGPVGQAPDSDRRSPAVAPLFEQPGVLTPRGKMVLEPSFQFGYSSSDRVALVGYTIIPALLIGLVDVREEKHNTSTATLTGRYGVSNRTEVEVKLPYVYRSDADVSREISPAAPPTRCSTPAARAWATSKCRCATSSTTAASTSPTISAACASRPATARTRSRSSPTAWCAASGRTPPAPACRCNCRPVRAFMACSPA